MPATERLENFAELLGRMREPFLLASNDGRIVAANVAGADALGTSVAALEGASLTSFSPDPASLLRLLLEPRSERSFPLRARDGRRLLCDAGPLGEELLLLRLSGAAEQRIRGFAQILSRLSGMSPAQGRALQEVTHALLAQGVSTMGALSGGIFLLDEAGANLELNVSVSYPKEFEVRYRLIPLTSNLPIVDSVKTTTPIFLGSLEDYGERYPEYAEAHPEVARNGFASLPLEVDRRCIGALIFGFDSPKSFTEEERGFSSSLAAECAEAIALARRLDAERASLDLAQRAAGRLERLQAFTGALAQAITPAEVNEAVVEMGMAATSAKSGGLWLLSKDEKSVSLVRGAGPTGPRSEDFQNVPLERLSRMPILDAVQSGSPVWLESCSQIEERYPDVFRAFSRGGEAALVGIPLFAQGRSIGGLAFAFEGVHPFLEDERAFLQVLTWYSAQAIERARLYEAERQAKEEAEANRRRSDFIADIGTLIASSLDYSDIVSAVARAAVPRIADWCVVELADHRLQGIPPVATHADPKKVALVLELNRRLRGVGSFDQGVAAVIRSGKAQAHDFTPEHLRARLAAFPQMVSDSKLAQLAIEVFAASVMIVPISARGAVLGAIVLSRATAHAYDEHDLAMAEELGRRLGLALDNARLYQEAREDDRLKDEFLAMLSHELRNPLAPIVSALDMMRLRGGDAFTRERALISRHVQHIVRLVDDLLDVSRITRGKIELVTERCEISDVIATAIELTGPLLVTRSHRLKVSAAESGLQVMADRGRLAQVVSNLLVNAAKHTDPGGEITVHAVVEGTQVLVVVRDTGMGIPPELLPKIFDLFVQGPGALDRAQSGLGIGLTVARSLVLLHGGSISAHSAGKGQGSEFSIRLPLAAPGAVVPAKPELDVEQSLGAVNWRVLVVDDNRDAAETLGRALEVLGCSTRVFQDGASALAALTEWSADLALLDIGLPTMDGYELARRMRETEAGRSMRLVAVTGYGQPSDRIRSSEAGFDEHLVKPVGVDTLRRVIARFRNGNPS